MNHVNVAVAGVPSPLSKMDKATQPDGCLRFAARRQGEFLLFGARLKATRDANARSARRQALGEVSIRTKAGFERLAFEDSAAGGIDEGNRARRGQSGVSIEDSAAQSSEGLVGSPDFGRGKIQSAAQQKRGGGPPRR
jgi:hypothetical protein